MVDQLLGHALGHAHAEHEILGRHLARIEIVGHLAVLDAHAALGVLRHGRGGAPQAKVRDARPVRLVVPAFAAGFRIARDLVTMESGFDEDPLGDLHMLGLDIVVGLLELAVEHHLLEARERLDRKRVHAHMGDPEPHRLLDRSGETLGGLPRDPAHQINAHVVETLASSRNSPTRRVGVVRAPERPKHRIVKALHADREPIDTERPDVAHHALIEAFRIRLHRAFDIGLEPHREGHRVQQHGKPRHPDMARRAAADIHGLDSPQLPLLRLPANLQAQILDVRIDNRRAPLNGLSGEIAIPAPLHAERNMQVESSIGIMRHTALLPIELEYAALPRGRGSRAVSAAP